MILVFGNDNLIARQGFDMANIKKGLKRLYIIFLVITSIVLAIAISILIIDDSNDPFQYILVITVPLYLLFFHFFRKFIFNIKLASKNHSLIGKASWMLSLSLSIPTSYIVYYGMFLNYFNKNTDLDFLLVLLTYGIAYYSMILFSYNFIIRLIINTVFWVIDGFKDNKRTHNSKVSLKREITTLVFMVVFAIFPLFSLEQIHQAQIRNFKIIGKNELDTFYSQFTNITGTDNFVCNEMWPQSGDYKLGGEDHWKVVSIKNDFYIPDFQIQTDEFSSYLYMYLNDKYPNQITFTQKDEILMDFAQRSLDKNIERVINNLNRHLNSSESNYIFRLPYEIEVLYVQRNDSEFDKEKNENFYGLINLYNNAENFQSNNNNVEYHEQEYDWLLAIANKNYYQKMQNDFEILQTIPRIRLTQSIYDSNRYSTQWFRIVIAKEDFDENSFFYEK